MPFTGCSATICTSTCDAPVAPALAALAADLPAAILADLLDININTALAWSTYAQTDWAAYLAARTRSESTRMFTSKSFGSTEL
jgi:hypothetical protein